jgi:tetratricopeptide (TPR) repeat protein
MMNPQPSPKFGSSKAAGAGASAPAAPAAPRVKVPPLFRRIDWLAMLICLAVVETIYLMTLSPQVTLEDSGELVTGSFYAGIPHPPGYPFWAIYSWIWTRIVPFGNAAWRVELGQAAAMGMGCSLIALMVSRGSSMLMEGIEELKGVVGKWENAICLVCGVTAGLLMALDNSMWKESVAINRISEFGVPWLIMVLLCLLRWIYAPHQRGYLYCAFFFLGICSTIHQTLIVAVMGVEIGIACTQPKLGRDLLFINTLAWASGYWAAESGVWTSFAQVNPTVFGIFNTIGVASLIACVWLTINTRGLLTEWKACLFIILLSLAGMSFYFYEAISGMTNPPMEWGYPRTVEGFFHALTRGQYDKINPTNIIKDPKMFVVQLQLLAEGVAGAFNWVFMFFAALPFLFFRKMKRRERNWLISVAAIYPFLGVLLTIFLNPQKDRQSVELLKVFFAASHTVVAILIGYGLALTAAYMATHYERFRRWGWMGGGVALVLACFCLMEAAGELYFGQAGEVSLGDLPHWVAQAFAPGQYGLPIYAGLILVALPVIFLGALAVCRRRAPLLVTLGLFAVMPVCSGLSHWFHSEQKEHWFGYWYGHDMFTPPLAGPDGKLTYDPAAREKAMKGTNANLVYPEMARDAVVYGGTDPGRFCPTYMVFCESFIPHDCQPEQDTNFDRRDCYVITQNALADPTYLDYIRAQYNRSLQIDPPFFQEFLPTELPRVFQGPTTALKWLDNIFEGIGAAVEKERRTGTSRFKEEHFTDVAKLAGQLCPHEGQDELSACLYGRLSKETQALVSSHTDPKTMARALARDFNRIMEWPSLYTAGRFEKVKLPPLILKAVQTEQLTNTTIRLNRRLLEEAYPGEIARSLGGVYPDTEIHTASLEELKQSEVSYENDAAQRLKHDREHPNEPRQIKPGEDVNVDDQGHMSFGGVLVVMGINSYVTKVMFDANPDHEFYVEESYPMDWMYPYLTPFGVIMKVNRHPLDLSDDDIKRDHFFWSRYSDRLVGNWIDYDTTPKQLCDFVDQAYLRHDYAGFKGDRKFIRDEDAQKGFSKLRSAIGASIYQWRAFNNRNPVERARLLKEAEFAFKQAFVYCPYSEGAYKYAELLMDTGRMEEALLVTKTFQRLDPYNRQIHNMVVQIMLNLGKREEALLAARDFLRLEPNNPTLSDLVEQLERKQPEAAGVSVKDIFSQIAGHLAAKRINEANAMLDQLLHSPQANGPILTQVAQYYGQMGNLAKAEEAMVRATQVEPNASQSWYNLASVQAIQGHAAAAGESLKKAFAANALERVAEPRMMDLRENARTNPNFINIRQTPEFQAVVGTN